MYDSALAEKTPLVYKLYPKILITHTCGHRSTAVLPTDDVTARRYFAYESSCECRRCANKRWKADEVARELASKRNRHFGESQHLYNTRPKTLPEQIADAEKKRDYYIGLCGPDSAQVKVFEEILIVLRRYLEEGREF